MDVKNMFGVLFLISCAVFQIATATVTDIRLVGGDHSYNGRVEVFNNGTWQTICDTNWDDNDATVICRQLGYDNPAQAIAYKSAHFGQGEGTVYATDLRCTGQEARISDCQKSVSNIRYCGHIKDAGVSCIRPVLEDTRLVGGDFPFMGRVELLINGTWGTICDVHWGDTDASVICRQLGYKDAYQAKSYTQSHFGRGSGPIYLSTVACSGREDNVLDCTALPFGQLASHSCTHARDAGVSCKRPTADGVRLMDGDGGHSGRVELSVNGTWGTVCNRAWDDNEAAVVCRQLGFSDTSAAYATNTFPQGTGLIYYSDLRCTGRESDLSSCPSSYAFGQPYSRCTHANDAGVSCTRPEIEAIRLSGAKESEGRLEVRVNGTWGTVCQDHFDKNDGIVVCRQLGFPDPYQATVYYDTHFGQGVGPVLMTSVGCKGHETSLQQCSAVYHHTCGHNKDVGISCAKPIVDEVRLAGGPTPWEGRVELRVNDTWGTVCNSRWDTNDAIVFCKQMGHDHPSLVKAFTGSQFGEGTGPIFLTELYCTGHEPSLVDCHKSSSRPWGKTHCSHRQDAGAVCFQLSVEEVRLKGGRTAYEGRVELRVDGVWGTLDSGDWTDKDSAVICRQLGYEDVTEARFYPNAHFGRGSGPVLLRDVRCSGHEASVDLCPFQVYLNMSLLAHNHDVGISCVDVDACKDANGGCSDVCVALPGNKTRCECPRRGHNLSSDGLTCEGKNNVTVTVTKPALPSDDNQCLHDNGGCSHTCRALHGDRWRCACPEGMLLSPDRRTCVLKDQPTTAASTGSNTIVIASSVGGAVVLVFIVTILVLVALFLKRIGKFNIAAASAQEEPEASGEGSLVFHNQTFSLDEGSSMDQASGGFPSSIRGDSFPIVDTSINDSDNTCT